MLTQENLFSKARMDDEPWFVDKVQRDQEAGKLEIWIDFEHGSAFAFFMPGFPGLISGRAK